MLRFVAIISGLQRKKGEGLPKSAFKASFDKINHQTEPQSARGDLILREILPRLLPSRFGEFSRNLCSRLPSPFQASHVYPTPRPTILKVLNILPSLSRQMASTSPHGFHIAFATALSDDVCSPILRITTERTKHEKGAPTRI